MTIHLTHVSTITLIAVAFCTSVNAQACDTSTPSNTQSISCANTGPGVDFSGINDLSVNITGEIVATTGDGLLAGSRLELVNKGRMETKETGSTLLRAEFGSSVTNKAEMVIAPANGAKGVILGDNSKFRNTSSGVISVGEQNFTDTLITMGQNSIFINEGLANLPNGYNAILIGTNSNVINTGHIEARFTAITAGSGSMIQNSGSITTNNSGAGILHGQGDLLVMNGPTGQIGDDTYSTAISAPNGELSLINEGTIYGTAMQGISAQSAVIQNRSNGQILANSGNSSAIVVRQDLELINDGLIENTYNFTISSAGKSTILNNGTIRKTIENNFSVFMNSGETRIINNGIIVGATPFHLGNFFGKTDILNSGTFQNTTTSSGATIGLFSNENDLVTNYGTIRGFLSIADLSNSADSDDMVVNYGRIIGNGGTAIQFNTGDDSLVLYSLDIQGDVIFGDGDDRVIVGEGASAGMLTFGSDLETVDLSANPAAIFTDNTLVVADASFLSELDMIRASDARTLGLQITDTPPGNGWWGAVGMDLRGDSHTGSLTLGRDFGTFGVFMQARQGTALGDDGLNAANSDSLLAGVRGVGSLGETTSLTAAAYVGRSEMVFSDANGGMDFGSAGDSVVGLSAGIELTIAQGLGLSARAGVERHEIDAYSLSSLGGANFEKRQVTVSYLDMEASISRNLGRGITAHPFLGASLLRSDGDATQMGLMGERTSFETAAGRTQGSLTLGSEFSAAGAWRARIETRVTEGNTLSGGATFTAHF